MRIREPTEALRAGRRALEGVEGCRIVEDFVWNEADSCWGLLLELRIEPDASLHGLPEKTRWYVLLQHDYPKGTISVMPASDGITVTFPHQAHNGPTKQRPWRSGRLCLDTPLTGVSRISDQSEPRGEEARLAWHTRRAIEWLELARRGELLAVGDDFELPDFDGSDKEACLIHAEDPERLSTWLGLEGAAGRVTISTLTQNGDRLHFARMFQTSDGRTVSTMEWGPGVHLERASATGGAWILLPSAPALDPWQAPQTWGELRAVTSKGGLDLDTLLATALRPLAGQAAPILLLGFPIPAVVGGAPVEVHWQPLRLPPVPRAMSKRRSARRRVDSRSVGMLAGFADHKRLRWGHSENWSPGRLGARGRLRPAARGRAAVLIGAGALGSLVAEMLVRGGVTRLTIFDADVLRAENLVRHTLGLSSIGESKASALARRLHDAAPHARIESHGVNLNWKSPPLGELFGEADLVVDCTASDDVLEILGASDSGCRRRWVSASVGFEGRRLYLFVSEGRSFPTLDFTERFAPWRRLEAQIAENGLFPRGGPGCWSPLFPAAYHDIMCMASLAIAELDALSDGLGFGPELIVFETISDPRGRISKVGRACAPTPVDVVVSRGDR